MTGAAVGVPAAGMDGGAVQEEATTVASGAPVAAGAPVHVPTGTGHRRGGGGRFRTAGATPTAARVAAGVLEPVRQAQVHHQR